MSARTIAVLGGGLTGLSSAFYLSRRFPTAEILLLERKARLGGWVQSERVQLPQNAGSIVLEGGPRTLRPKGKSVLELINLLGLEGEVLTVPKSSPPAKARFLYVPEAFGSKVTGLHQLPSSISSLFTSPLSSVILLGALREIFKSPNRPFDITDESVDAFLARRFGSQFATILGSALVHGIYASDSRQLSVKSAFPALWSAEKRGLGSIFRGMMLSSAKLAASEGYDLGRTLDAMRGVSVYSFKNGMETLTKALESHLHTLRNVTILKGAPISEIKPKDHFIEVYHSSSNVINATHVVSALPLRVLHDLIGEPQMASTPHLLINPMSTVQVVNLVFACPPERIHPEGFGYLVPRPPSGYLLSSEAGILGTVFDSCSLHGQDSPVTPDYYHNAAHTKVSVMIGGPYTRLPIPARLSSEDSDKLPPFVQIILNELKVHLGRDLPPPVYWRIWNNEACIPTLLPGHMERMERLEFELRTNVEWRGRLCAIGAGVGGVSVPDCVEAGRQVGREWT